MTAVTPRRLMRDGTRTAYGIHSGSSFQRDGHWGIFGGWVVGQKSVFSGAWICKPLGPTSSDHIAGIPHENGIEFPSLGNDEQFENSAGGSNRSHPRRMSGPHRSLTKHPSNLILVALPTRFHARIPSQIFSVHPNTARPRGEQCGAQRGFT